MDLTQTEIEALKQEHGELVLVTVKHGDQEYQAIFKEPTFNELKAMTKIAKSDEIQAVKSAYENSIVKACPEIEGRDMLKVKSIEALMARTQNTTAEAKNL
jgi:tRNA(Ile2) C34 agmatinyltransferase TiaS